MPNKGAEVAAAEDAAGAPKLRPEKPPAQSQAWDGGDRMLQPGKDLHEVFGEPRQQCYRARRCCMCWHVSALHAWLWQSIRYYRHVVAWKPAEESQV